MHKRLTLMLLSALWTVAPCAAQYGTKGDEWRYYGGDAGSTKYSPLDQINEANAKDLQIAWRWKAQNFGRRPEFNWQATPLMVNKVLYFTAGTRRVAAAVDATNGETLWTYRLDEGERGAVPARLQHRGLAYWTDGKGDERILMISPGFQLVGLNAKNGHLIPGFGKEGLVELTEGLDREVVKPGTIGSSSPPIVIGDVVIVGPALQAGTVPVSKQNVPGYIRGYDVRSGKRLWTFRTVPQAGEFGNDTWLNDSWKFTGNTGAWAPLSGDQELGYVYVPVEAATGDFYGGNRPGNNLYSGSVVCLDAKTGKRIWHFQLVHHDIWDYDTASPPILLDVTVAGRKRKVLAQPSKTGFLYVFDRVTGQPIWPIEEKPAPKSNVPGEWTAATQPIPTKPAAYEHQGITADDLIDFTPELKAEAMKIIGDYKLGPLFTPPHLTDSEGKRAILMQPNNNGATNWAGGAADPETGIVYVSSVFAPVPMAVGPADPKRSDMGYVGGFGRRGGGPGAAGGAPPGAPVDPGAGGEGRPMRTNLGPQGLPLVRPPWGKITAIDLNTGDHVWWAPNGHAPEAVRNHPALKGIDLSKAGNPERALIMVTKTLVVTGEGSGLFSAQPGAGGPHLRFLNKKTGALVHEIKLPANMTSVPMTYMVNDKQYLVMAVGASGVPAELIAYAIP